MEIHCILLQCQLSGILTVNIELKSIYQH